jgi:hypothetical protein
MRVEADMAIVFWCQSHIYGVDIEEACKKYENDYTTILVGDQADREFWARSEKR